MRQLVFEVGPRRSRRFEAPPQNLGMVQRSTNANLRQEAAQR
jgi:hypothetical protein